MEEGDEMKKLCKKCLVKKSIKEFIPDTRYKDGVKSECRGCTNAYRRIQRLNPIVKILERNTRIRFQLKNPKKYRANISKAQGKYNAANKPKLNALKAKSFAKKLNAVPSWFTGKHQQDVEVIYRQAQFMRNTTGKPYWVGCKIPLQYANDVCGLFVPWNLEIKSGHKKNRYM